MERLERLDQRLSRPVFQMKLPEALTAGFPHAFFGPTPLLLAALATQTLAAWVACVALLAFGLGSFYGGLAGWGDFTKLTKLVIFLMPSLCVYLSSHLPPPGPAISTISLICAALCVACAVPLKALSDRRRPAVRWGQEAQRATLLAPYIKAMCKGGQSREAWPSSDAAVMAANAILLWNVLKTSSLSSSLAVALSVSVFALACFGRMYFWAHHLFDVLSGAFAPLLHQGLLGSLIVLGALHFRWCSSWHFLLSFVLFLLSLGLGACAKAARWQETLLLLDYLNTFKLGLPNSVGQSAAVSALERRSLWAEALKLFGDFRRSKATCRNATLGALANSARWRSALQFFASAATQRLTDAVTQGAVVAACQTASRWAEAVALVSKSRNTVALSAAVSSCAHAARWDVALALLHLLRPHGDEGLVAYNAAISACEKAGLWEAALCLLRDISRLKLSFNGASSGVATRNGSSAANLKPRWKRKLQPNTVSYNAAISACERDGRWQVASQLMAQRLSQRLKVDVAGLGALVSTCCQASQWERAINWVISPLARQNLVDASCASAALLACQRSSKWLVAVALFARATRLDLPPAAHVSLAFAGQAVHVSLCRALWPSEISNLNAMDVAVAMDGVHASGQVDVGLERLHSRRAFGPSLRATREERFSGVQEAKKRVFLGKQHLGKTVPSPTAHRAPSGPRRRASRLSAVSGESAGSRVSSVDPLSFEEILRKRPTLQDDSRSEHGGKSDATPRLKVPWTAEKALASLMIFQGCRENFINYLAAGGEHVMLKPGEFRDLREELNVGQAFGFADVLAAGVPFWVRLSGELK
eukprot:g11836.t1